MFTKQRVDRPSTLVIDDCNDEVVDEFNLSPSKL